MTSIICAVAVGFCPTDALRCTASLPNPALRAISSLVVWRTSAIFPARTARCQHIAREPCSSSNLPKIPTQYNVTIQAFKMSLISAAAMSPHWTAVAVDRLPSDAECSGFRWRRRDRRRSVARVIVQTSIAEMPASVSGSDWRSPVTVTYAAPNALLLQCCCLSVRALGTDPLRWPY